MACGEVRGSGGSAAHAAALAAPPPQSSRSGVAQSYTRAQVRLKRREVSTAAAGRSEAAVSADDADSASALGDSVARTAAVVALVTLVCKLLGLVREMASAAAFGVGSVADAFGYASLLPSAFVVLLGGVNGPFHSAIVAACAARPRAEGAALARVVLTRVSLATGLASVAMFLLAAPLVALTAPGLPPAEAMLAAEMLRLMSPTAYLSGVLGVGFGLLSAYGRFLAPAASPALSSATAIAALVAFCAAGGQATLGASAGGACLALAFTIGALAQCALQGLAGARAGVPILLAPRWSPNSEHVATGVRQVFKLLLPAALASGMLQLATYTDLFFASSVPRAAAAMGYANLLVMAPVGVLSNALLLPALPILARAAANANIAARHSDVIGDTDADATMRADTRDPDGELRLTLRRCVLIAAAVGAPLAATLAPLGAPLVSLVYERAAFGGAAVGAVAPLVAAYALGAPLYLVRDVVVRAFYALGDGAAPARASAAAIAANIALDYTLCVKCGLGALGLVAATAVVNGASALALLVGLGRRIGGLGLGEYARPAAVIAAAALAAALFSKVFASGVDACIVGSRHDRL